MKGAPGLINRLKDVNLFTVKYVIDKFEQQGHQPCFHGFRS
jgi:hypothetical protein